MIQCRHIRWYRRQLLHTMAQHGALIGGQQQRRSDVSPQKTKTIDRARFDDPQTQMIRFFEYEEEVKRDPFAIHGWLQYLEVSISCNMDFRSKLYERALGRLPRSYKLWWMYLNELERSHDPRVVQRSVRGNVAHRLYGP